MDTLYIKMADTPEIQGRQWEYGDCFIQFDAYGEHSDMQFMSRELDDPYYGDYPDFDNGKRAIWLPRQEDLQKMLGYRLQVLFDKFVNWNRTAKRVHQDDAVQVALTMNQLWLAFVMKEKHNKVWNGEKWI